MRESTEEIPAPSGWKITTLEEGDTESSASSIVWTYQRNRLMTVRIQHRPSEDLQYAVKKSNGDETVTFEPPESNATAAIDLANLLMRGSGGVTGGLSFSKFKRRLGVSASSWRVHARIRWWDDLKKVAYDGEFSHIDGVDSETNNRLQQAITGPFLERSQEEIVRRVSDDPAYYEVYMIIPVLTGWKVQKGSRYICVDESGGPLVKRVLLPLSEEEGTLYTSREAAVSAAKSAAEDSIDDQFEDYVSEQQVAFEDIELLDRRENQPTIQDFVDET